MTKEEKIAFLRGYREQLERARQLTMELEEMRQVVMRITPILNDMPGRGGPNLHRLEESVERAERAEEQLAETLEQAIQAQCLVRAAIETVEEERLRQILRARYLLGQSWQKVAETLNMDERWARRQHERALGLLELE